HDRLVGRQELDADEHREQTAEEQGDGDAAEEHEADALVIARQQPRLEAGFAVQIVLRLDGNRRARGRGAHCIPPLRTSSLPVPGCTVWPLLMSNCGPGSRTGSGLPERSDLMYSTIAADSGPSRRPW